MLHLVVISVWLYILSEKICFSSVLIGIIPMLFTGHFENRNEEHSEESLDPQIRYIFKIKTGYKCKFHNNVPRFCSWVFLSAVVFQMTACYWIALVLLKTYGVCH